MEGYQLDTMTAEKGVLGAFDESESSGILLELRSVCFVLYSRGRGAFLSALKSDCEVWWSVRK